MALEKVGLGGVLTLDGSSFGPAAKKASDALGRFTGMAKGATQSVTRFGEAFKQSAKTMRSGAASIGSGVSTLNQSMMGLAVGFSPVALAVGSGVQKAAEFEKQMSAVGAITRATEDDLAALRSEAQRQGVVSVFSATESAQAMEFLARAGADTKQIVAGLGGVMAAAAADSIELSTAADIVSQVVKGMGMEFSEASHVADVLALTSAKANTNITSLGESFKFGVSQAKSMGIGVEETAAIFGRLADAGLRGSLGGTAFTNMLIKLGKPTTKGAALLKKWGVELTQTDGSMRKIADIVQDVQGHINKYGKATDRAKAATELFGIRGARAYNALATAGAKSVNLLEKELIASSFGIGAAQEMANKRLDNFLGALKLFGSSVEAVSIEFFGPMLGSFKEATQDMTAGLNSVMFAVQGLRKNENAAALAGVKFAKQGATQFAERFGFAKRMEERAGSLAEATVQALSTQAIGEEKLSREQRRARGASFAQFVELGLLRSKMTDEARETEMARVKGVIKAGLAEGASQQKQVLLRQEMIKAISDQTKGAGKMTEAQRVQHQIAMSNAFDRQLALAKEDTAARAFLERQKQLLEIEQKHGPAAKAIAEGFLEAIDTLRTAFADAIKWIRATGAELRASLGDDQLKRFTKLASIGAIIAAAIVPVSGALLIMSFALKGIIGPFVGFAKIAFGTTKILWGLVGALKVVRLFAAKHLPVALALLKTTAVMAFTAIKFAAVAAFGALKTIALGALVAAKAAFAALLPLIWPIVAIVGVLVAAFALYRREGESVGETFTRLWKSIKAGVVGLWNITLKPFIEGFRTAFANMLQIIQATWATVWGGIQAAWALTVGAIGAVLNELWLEIRGDVMEVKNFFIGAWNAISAAVTDVFATARAWIIETFGDIFGISTETTSAISSSFATAGQMIATVLGEITNVAIGIFGGLIRGVLAVVRFLVPILITPFRTLYSTIKNVILGIVAIFKGDFIRGLTKLAVGLGDALTMPFRMMLQGLLKAVGALPTNLVESFVSKDTLAKLETFAKYGFGGPPKRAKQTVDIATKGAEKLADVIPITRVRPTPAAATTVAAVENAPVAAAVLRQKAQMQQEDRAAKQAAAKQKQIQANVHLKDERKLKIDNKMCIDGENVAVASASHKQSIYERSGGKSTPFLRRKAVETGVRVNAEATG